MRAVLLLVVGTCIAGCPGPTDPITPDGQVSSDGDVEKDAPEGDSKLTIAWASAPVVPGTTPGGNRIDEIKFRMENLKATVDVDPTDPNTTKDEYKLHWDSDTAPEAIEFGNAPAGRYTSIVLQLDEGDNEDAFEIRGQAPDGDSFKLDDNASLSISMNCNITLAAGEEKTVVIDIDVNAAVDALDINALGSGDGVDHHLDADNSEEMAAFRAALQQAFSVRANQE